MVFANVKEIRIFINFNIIDDQEFLILQLDYIIKIHIITPINEINDPIEDFTFYAV